MRFALFIGRAPILLVTGCYLPRDWKTGDYADACTALDEPVPEQAQLVITLRLPRCAGSSGSSSMLRF